MIFGDVLADLTKRCGEAGIGKIIGSFYDFARHDFASLSRPLH
jgi:hypothetical protein